MIMLRRSYPFRVAFTAFLLAIPLAVVAGVAIQADADTPNIPVTATATPTTNLVNGSVIDINVDAKSPPNAVQSNIYSVQARLCRPGVSINNQAAFNPSQGGNCISTPINGSDVTTIDEPAPPQLTAHTTFRVGVGSVDLVWQGGTQRIECGPGFPCQLVLRLGVPNGNAFKSFNLSFAGTATTTSTTTSTSTSTSTTSTSSTTSTTPPPAGGSYFHPLAPVRILDSRTATGGWNGTLAAGAPRPLQITGANTVPSTADAAVLNVTATGGTHNSFITAYPTGSSVPTASNVNFAAGQTIPNLVTVKIGTGGQVSFNNANGAVNVVADLVGYYDAAGSDKFTAVSPSRILDSRTANGGWNGTLVAGASRTLTVTGAASVPASADAVIINVTATAGSDNSFLTAYPTGTSLPNASNVNFAAGQTIPNLVTVKVGTAGQVSFNNAAGAVHVIADVVGYYDASSGKLFHSLAPTRVLDSRLATGGWNSPLVSTAPRTLVVGGGPGVPASADSIIANATVTESTADSFLTVYPAPGSVPGTSNLNFAAGQTIPNLVAVKLGSGGGVGFATAAGSTNVIFDVVGYFATT